MRRGSSRGGRCGFRRRCFRRLLGLSVGAELLLRRGLRYNQRRCLRMRKSTCELHCREGCGGLQKWACFVRDTQSPDAAAFMAHSGNRFKPRFTLSPLAYPKCPDLRPALSRRSDRVYADLPVPVPAFHPACGPAALLAVALRRDRASAAALPAVDCPEGFRAAAPTVAPA